jgi:hypothetical protein
VLYTDADTYPLAYFGNLFHICRRDGGIMLFASENHWQHQWCKRDCFITMGMDSQPVAGHLAQAGVARFMVFEKGPWAADQFLMEWLTYCVNSRANTFDPSQYGEERPGFIEHRAEQAIMTNLAYKYGLRLYREACGAGESIDRDRHLYPQLFVQVDVPGEKVSTEPLGSSFADVPYPC